MKLTLTRCLDCGAVKHRVIQVDLPINCLSCGSEYLSW